MAEPITVTITNLNGPLSTVKVQNKVAESAVTSVAGKVGDVLLTQADVAGLENVNNTSDLNKPISTATQSALDLKSDIGHKHFLADISGAGTAAAADTGDFATFSHNHLISDISGIGTAATLDIGDFAPFVHTHEIADITDLNINDFATSGQGALADSALQSGDNISQLVNDAGYLTFVSAHPIESVNGQSGIVVLDADDIDDTSTFHKFATSGQLANADSALQSGDNISLLVNNIGYLTDAIQSGDNVSFLANDAGYLTDAVRSGDNVSLLVNDENYVSSGDNVSLFVNDSGYLNEAIQSGDNVSFLNNDSLYVASGDNISNLVNDAGYITSAGTFKFSYRSETGNYTPISSDYTIDCISGNQTITMLDASTVSGQIFVVKNSSPGVVTISGTASQTIDGYDSVQTDFPQSLTLQSTNTNWIII